jgi:glycosyltransferase involved in cell wall biosynthesis
MAAMKYPVAPGASYLTTELADALVEAGHEVEVLHLDWDSTDAGAPSELRSPSGVRVVHVPAPRLAGLPGAAGHAAKFLMSGRAAARAAGRHFDLSRFDAFIGWMPSVAIAPLVALVRGAGIAHRHLIIWDFFPDHYHEIGRIPGGPVLRAARWLEQRTLRHFTTIFCTTPGNAAYLRHKFRVNADKRVEVMPAWTRLQPAPVIDRRAERGRHGLPLDRPVAVFGGQMSAGRGFEQMLGAASLAWEAGSGLHVLLIGDGPLAAEIAQRAVSLPNVHCRPPIARENYRRLIAACDVGLAATVAGVSSHSFPSKILDYLAVGLPVVAALEEGNEVAGMLEEYRLGEAVPLGNARGLFLAAQRLASDPLARAEAQAGGARCLAELLDVRHTVSALVRASG